MKIATLCTILSSLVSLFAYLCLDNRSVEAGLVLHVIPLGVLLGLLAALQGVRGARKFTALLGIVQLAFWPLLAYLLHVTEAGLARQILLAVLTTVYLIASLTFYPLAGIEWRRIRRLAESSQEADASAGAEQHTDDLP